MYNITISLADLYQFSANVAVWCALPNLPTVNGATPTTTFPWTFLYGRKDAPTCSDTNGLPNAENAYVEVNNLAVRWGMTMPQLTALMGAHTLGTTKTANSGYSTPMAAGMY
jgi:hypothetical protein